MPAKVTFRQIYNAFFGTNKKIKLEKRKKYLNKEIQRFTIYLFCS